MLVLLLEDDVDYAEVIAETLRRDSHQVVVAGNAQSALRFARQSRPDLLVLDVMVPDQSGLDALRELRRTHPRLPALVLSSLDRRSDVLAGFDAGADDYLTKPFDPRELLARVRAILRRYEDGDGGSGERADEEAEDDDEPALDDLAAQLTDVEREILRELLAAPGQVLPYAYINERVWNYSNLPDSTLLKGHISSIRRKLRDAGYGDSVIRTVQSVGYAFEPESDEVTRALQERLEGKDAASRHRA